MLYGLKIEFSGGHDIVLEEVEEFEAGFKYFYVRTISGSTHSFNRSDVAKVRRRTDKSKEWVPVLLRRPKFRKRLTDGTSEKGGGEVEA